jgi:opacity protein-like surface antigen
MQKYNLIKTVILAIIFIFTITFISVSYANGQDNFKDRVYISGGFGMVSLFESDVSSVEVNYQKGWASFFALGYYTPQGLRPELEIFYQSSDIDDFTVNIYNYGTCNFDLDGTVTAKGVLTNMYYDFRNTSILTPYIGAGVGIAEIEVEDVIIRECYSLPNISDVLFIYQIGAGVSSDITKNVGFDSRIRYFASFDDVELDGMTASYAGWVVSLALRYSFE